MNMMNDISVTADVLREIVIHGKANNFNIEHAAAVIPLANSLIESKYEPYIKIGIQVVLALLGSFRTLVVDTLTANATSGVDLNREERAKKCQNCLEAFRETKESAALSKNTQREKVGEISRKLTKELDNFLWECHR